MHCKVPTLSMCIKKMFKKVHLYVITVQNVSFFQGPRRNLRNDLLIAADSITNTMSSLVKELNSGKKMEEGENNGASRNYLIQGAAENPGVTLPHPCLDLRRPWVEKKSFCCL